MYYYLLGLIIYSFVLLAITKKSKILGEILAILILTFITFMIGLRYEVGIDYHNYSLDFDVYYNKVSFEYIFYTIRYAVKMLFDKFYVLTFIMILTSNVYIYLGLKKRKIQGIYLILALMIYSSSMAIIFMNIMRQGVSIAIFFYSSVFIKERNFKKYFFYILLGAGFHLSILFLLPLYLLPNIKFKKASFFVAIISAYLLVYLRFVNYIINFIAYRVPFYSKYYNHQYLLNDDVNLLSLGVLLNVVFFYLLILFSTEDENRKLDKTYYEIGLLLNIMTIATFMIGRIGVYFSIFGIVAIPQLIESIRDRRLRRLLFILAVLVSIGLFSQNFILNPGPLKLEYKSIFSQ